MYGSSIRPGRFRRAGHYATLVKATKNAPNSRILRQAGISPGFGTDGVFVRLNPGRSVKRDFSSASVNVLRWGARLMSGGVPGAPKVRGLLDKRTRLGRRSDRWRSA